MRIVHKTFTCPSGWILTTIPPPKKNPDQNYVHTYIKLKNSSTLLFNIESKKLAYILVAYNYPPKGLKQLTKQRDKSKIKTMLNTIIVLTYILWSSL